MQSPVCLTLSRLVRTVRSAAESIRFRQQSACMGMRPGVHHGHSLEASTIRTESLRCAPATGIKALREGLRCISSLHRRILHSAVPSVPPCCNTSYETMPCECIKSCCAGATCSCTNCACTDGGVCVIPKCGEGTVCRPHSVWVCTIPRGHHIAKPRSSSPYTDFLYLQAALAPLDAPAPAERHALAWRRTVLALAASGSATTAMRNTAAARILRPLPPWAPSQVCHFVRASQGQAVAGSFPYRDASPIVMHSCR